MKHDRKPTLPEADRFEIIIGLDDFAQPVLGRAVAAIGVGVVTLDQGLEAGLDLLDAGVGLEPERIERLALGIADDAGLALAQPLTVRPCAGLATELAQQIERIFGPVGPGI